MEPETLTLFSTLPTLCSTLVATSDIPAMCDRSSAACCSIACSFRCSRRSEKKRTRAKMIAEDNTTIDSWNHQVCQKNRATVKSKPEPDSFQPHSLLQALT